MPLKLVITLLVAASLLGGGAGAGVALVADHGKVGPRGPQGAKGPPGPPGIYADVGVLEARIAGLERRLSRLERRLRASAAPARQSRGGVSTVEAPSGSRRQQNPPPKSSQERSEAAPVTNGSRRQWNARGSNA
jgi:hypothetical protein